MNRIFQNSYLTKTVSLLIIVKVVFLTTNMLLAYFFPYYLVFIIYGVNMEIFMTKQNFIEELEKRKKELESCISVRQKSLKNAPPGNLKICRKKSKKTEGLDALYKFHFLFGYVHSGIGAFEDGFYVSVG